MKKGMKNVERIPRTMNCANAAPGSGLLRNRTLPSTVVLLQKLFFVIVFKKIFVQKHVSYTFLSNTNFTSRGQRQQRPQKASPNFE